jgi:hypothetical protein
MLAPLGFLYEVLSLFCYLLDETLERFDVFEVIFIFYSALLVMFIEGRTDLLDIGSQKGHFLQVPFHLFLEFSPSRPPFREFPDLTSHVVQTALYCSADFAPELIHTDFVLVYFDKDILLELQHQLLGLLESDLPDQLLRKQ